MPRGQAPQRSSMDIRLIIGVVVAVFVGALLMMDFSLVSSSGSVGVSSPAASTPPPVTAARTAYEEAAAECSAHLSQTVLGSVAFFGGASETTDWQQWAASAELRAEHAKLEAAGACSPSEQAQASTSWTGPALGESRMASCVRRMADGRACVPAGCREVEDAAKCAAGSAAVGRTPGTETLPPWVVLPTCEVLDKCPALKGWPVHKHTLCASRTTAAHCTAQVPPPADPSIAPDLTHEYKPSAFESAWYKTVKDKYKGQPGGVCQVQDEFVDEIKSWVQQSEAWFADPSGRADAKYDATIFSTMTTTYTTPSGETKSVDVPIEPLAGILRHPYSGMITGHPKAGDKGFCNTHGAPARGLWDWRYLVMDAAQQPHFKERYPGRKILLDLGMTAFTPRDASVDYNIADARTYVDLFGASGIKFDLVYGWEPKPEFDTPKFYSGIVSYGHELVPKYCNVNKMSVPAIGHVDNAVELVAQLWRPGDYIVFKLDIDHGETELAILEVLKGCPGVVAEFIFEYHCNVPEILSCCWGDTAMTGERGRYDTALETLAGLRRQGIRAHFWV